MGTILSLDLSLFHLINSEWTTPWLDHFFANVTNLHRVWWVYSFVFPALIIAAIWRKGAYAFKAVLVMAVALGASDLLNHRLLKPGFGRERPFKTVELQAQLKIPPAGGLSFPSNHAANTMVAAVVLATYFPPLRFVFIGISLIAGYSRPYLGVHYPSDVVVGWIEGALIALLFLYLVKRWVPSWAPRKVEPRDEA